MDHSIQRSDREQPVYADVRSTTFVWTFRAQTNYAVGYIYAGEWVGI